MQLSAITLLALLAGSHALQEAPSGAAAGTQQSKDYNTQPHSRLPQRRRLRQQALEPDATLAALKEVLQKNLELALQELDKGKVGPCIDAAVLHAGHVHNNKCFPWGEC